MLPQFTHSGIKLKCPLPLRTRALRVPKGVEVRSAMTSIDQNINLCVDSHSSPQVLQVLGYTNVAEQDLDSLKFDT